MAIGGALAGAIGAGGCSLDSSVPPQPDASSATISTPPPLNVDADLVDEVLRQISVAHQTVRESIRLHRDLRTTLKPLELLHRAHARELGDLPAATGSLGSANESAPQVLSRVGAAEVLLQRQLVRGATSAESGALALLLASMAAAVAQERATL